MLCGAHGVKLVVHHKKPFKEDPDTGLNFRNLMVLCETCHRDYHHFYSAEGRKERTIARRLTENAGKVTR
jgi:5-methylcytosine-specific restriction endonuclease McrA